MNNFRPSIVPVPVHFLKENSLYLIYEALLMCADKNGYIDISNEELAKIIQKSSSSTTVTTSISILKNIGVVERISKKNHNRDHNNRVLRLIPPYDEISCLFKNAATTEDELFFADIKKITNSTLVKSEVSCLNHISKQSTKSKSLSNNKDFLDCNLSKNIKDLTHIEGSYLNDLDVNKYFKAYEYYSIYNLIQYVGPRRDISDEIISHNLPFVYMLNEKKINNKISKIIKESKFKPNLEYHFDINKHAEEINPKVFKLFNFRDELNIENLNSRYKSALVAHPDSLNNINRAFLQYNRLIKMYDLSSDEDSIRSFLTQETGFGSASDFAFFLSCQIFRISIDIFDIEKSIETLYYIHKNLLINKRNIKCFFIGMSYGINRLYKLILNSNKSNCQFDILEDIKLLNSSDDDFNKFYYENYLKNEELINNKKRFMYKINHIKQAENAYKYEIINKSAYDNLVKKFTLMKNNEKRDKKNADIESQKKLKIFAKAGGFIQNLEKHGISNIAVQKKYVPGLGDYKERFIHLTEDQKHEYVAAFRPPFILDLMKKYKTIRMKSYLLNLIKNYDEFESKIINECIFLSDILNDNRFLLINEAYTYLSSIDAKIRNEKLRILAELDRNEPFIIRPLVTRNEFGVFNVKAIEVSKEYLDFIKNSFEDMLSFKNKPNYLF